MINIKGCKFNKAQVKIGTKIEMEHTNSPRVAEKIAKQHLCESSKYYEALKQMEKNLKIK